MQALSVDRAGRLDLIQLPRPAPGPGQVLLRSLQVGICATDREMVRTGTIFTIPPGDNHLILGHEGVAEVIEVGADPGGLQIGDVVVPVAYRRCEPMHERCRVDMCPYGKDRRAGINSHGFLAEYFVREPEYLVKADKKVTDVAMLLEPLTVTLKPFTDASGIRERYLGLPCVFRPQDLATKLLIIGIGPIGMLGVFGARALGWDVVAIDVLPPDSPKAGLITAVGATYHDATRMSPAEIKHSHGEFDIVAEAVQDASALPDYAPLVGMNGVFILLGWSGSEQLVTMDMAGLIRELLTKQVTVLASTGAGTPHYEEGMRLMGVIEDRYPGVLRKVPTHRYPMDQFEAGFGPPQDHQIKAVIEVA